LCELREQPLALLVDDLMHAWRHRRLIFVCGNGGSAANASHLVEDIGKCTIPAGNPECPRFRMISLSENTPYLLAWANDDGFDRVYVEQLINLASPRDLLLAISTSGHSENVLRAAEWAGRNGLITWALTGAGNSPLLELTDRAIRVPSENVGVIETAHLGMIHWLVDELRARLEDAPGSRAVHGLPDFHMSRPVQATAETAAAVVPVSASAATD
jgi:D-sedoheptulose 7-phosphate isomerase